MTRFFSKIIFVRRFIPIFFLVALNACEPKPAGKPEYPEHVGDIPFDTSIDDPGFVVCDEKMIYQYYNFGKGLQYKGEKSGIDDYFKEEHHAKEQAGQSGLLTIRFIVNCHGVTGRFRAQGMDKDYNAMEFDRNLMDRYTALMRTMNGWIPGTDGTHQYDYYQYLTFKLENGKLMEIMP